jgi:predicted transcriptional regulator of viral defense system
MRKSKYSRPLAQLLKMPAFTAKDAARKGIPSYELSYYCKRGIIERIAHGLYRPAHDTIHIDAQWEDLALTAKSIPHGVICLISALCIYGLTDQIMRQSWIAIPNSAKKAMRPHLRIVRLRNMALGKTKIKLGRSTVNIFDRERTIIDSFRLLSHEVAIKALKAYLSWTEGYKPDLRKLQEYARLLKVEIHPYVLALTT